MNFVHFNSPWMYHGGRWTYGVDAGEFSYGLDQGRLFHGYGSRL